MSEKVEKKETKNILITGKRQIGKTTLIQNVLNMLNSSVAGYHTIPYEIEGVFQGYEIRNIETNDKRPISKKQEDGTFQAIGDTFENFGVDCLHSAMNSFADIIVMDEIGRFERHSKNFITYIHNVFDSHKFVLAVLKKEPIEFIEEIKKRNDIFLIELDEVNAKEANEDIIRKYYNYYK